MLALFLLPILLSAGTSQSSIPANWVVYSPGTCNVVISAPHGGSEQAIEIAARTHGCLANDGVTCLWQKGCSPASASACKASDAKDSYTQEVATLIVQHLTEKYNCVPHFVRSNLHRSRMDPNREIEEAAQGDPLAQEAWQTYHENYMESAVETIRSNYGKGLVFDFHGQSHSEQWTELGYLLPKYKLNAGSADLTDSSIRGLAARVNPASAADLLSGPQSFGGFLEASGQKVVPGPTYPSPGSGNYYNGGYITRRYGSRDSGSIDAIQVEIPNGIRFDQAKREAFAVDVAKAIDDYKTAHGYNLLFT